MSISMHLSWRIRMERGGHIGSQNMQKVAKENNTDPIKRLHLMAPIAAF